MKVLLSIYRFLASYAFSCIIFFFLLVLTLLGTLEQVEHGLYATQKKYFESFFLVHNFFDTVPVLLPGVGLLLVLLFINLLFGAILRARKGWSRIGVLIAHVGIMVLLVGSFITYRYSLNGYMSLAEREQSNIFESYNDWEIAVTAPKGDGSAVEHLISSDKLNSLKPGFYNHEASFILLDLPFELTLSGYTVNSAPQQATAGVPSGTRVADGFYLRSLPPDKEAERNVPGVYATLKENGSGKTHEGILWGLSNAPWTVNVDGTNYSFDLRKQRWELPFTVVLDKFTRELYPGTGMPKSFTSDVTKIDGDSRQAVKISMNEPLRHKGYTLYQSSWGNKGEGPGGQLYSVFAVVNNPADQFPLYACLIITFGLLVHFLYRLVAYLRTEGQRAS